MSVPIGPLLIDLVLHFIHLVNSTSAAIHLSNIMNILYFQLLEPLLFENIIHKGQYRISY